MSRARRAIRSATIRSGSTSRSRPAKLAMVEAALDSPPVAGVGRRGRQTRGRDTVGDPATTPARAPDRGRTNEPVVEPRSGRRREVPDRVGEDPATVDLDRDRHRIAPESIVEIGRVLEIADREQGRGRGAAGPGVDEGRLEDAGVWSATDDDDVVGARGGAEILDNGPDDRVGRDRARQPLEDPGEALGLVTPARLEILDRDPMEDRGKPDDDDQQGDRPVAEPGIGPQPEDGEQTEEEERDGEDEPGAADPGILRPSGWMALGRWRHVRC